MVKKYLLISILLALIFSCKPPTSRGGVEPEPDVFTQAYVDRAYPHWDVGIAGFLIQDSSVTLTRAEREFVVKGIAIMRVLVNTPEFEQKVLAIEDPMLSYYTTNNAQLANTPWYVTNQKQNLDKHRILHTIKRIGYDLYVQKQKATHYVQAATIKDMVYSYMDYKNDYTMGIKVMLFGKDWTQWPGINLWGLNSFIGDFFHETLHNIGYNHDNTSKPSRFDSAPYLIGDGMKQFYGHEGGKDKYATQIAKMQEFYVNKYRAVIDAEPQVAANVPGTGKPRRSH